MFAQLDTLWFSTHDMEAAVAFYRDVLGAQMGNVSPYWSDFELAGHKFGIHPGKTGESKPGWVVGLTCQNLDELKSKLEAAGSKFDPEYHQVPGGQLLTFYDPDGNMLQAVSRGL